MQRYPFSGRIETFSLSATDGHSDACIKLYAWLTPEQFDYYQEHEGEIFAARSSRARWSTKRISAMMSTASATVSAAPVSHSAPSKSLSPASGDPEADEE